jgi:hypothetical protein
LSDFASVITRDVSGASFLGRARSIFERAIDIDYKHPPLWIKYAEFEMRRKFINHARNVWDRAVTLLPRVDLFWYKYSCMSPWSFVVYCVLT